MLSGEKIVIVEDDPSSADIFKQQLTALGFDVVGVFQTGEESIAFIEETPCDLVLLDIYLQTDLNGIETAKIIEEKFNIPVIFISGADDSQTVQEAINSRPFGYVFKPSKIKSLETAVKIGLYHGKLEKELRASEHRLNLILESSPHAILQLNNLSQIEYCNRQAEKLFALPSSKLIGKELASNCELSLIGDPSPIPFSKVLELTSNKSEKFNLINFSQQRFVVNISNRSLNDNSGKHIITIDDVSEANENLKKLSLLAASLENLSDGILITDLKSNNKTHEIIYANPSAEKILGYGNNQLLHEDLFKMLDESTFSVLKELIRESLISKKSSYFETAFSKDQQTRILVEWSITIIESTFSGHPIVIHSIRDISRVRQLEDNLNQSQKLEAIGQLASGIAHDFNNIVAIISGLSEVIMIKSKDNKSIHDSARHIFETSQRGNKIISELMLFSRQDPESLHDKTELCSSLELIIPLIRHLLPSTIKITSSIELAQIEIPISKTKLEQILFNLATNARDAMEPNPGELKINAYFKTISDELANNINPPLPKGDYAVISVEDQGGGIPTEIINHIFEPFYTTKPKGKGTGLGLSTIYGICSKANGGIRVYQFDKGTKFEIYLPFTPLKPAVN